MLRLALIGCGSHSEHAHAAPLARYVSQHPGEIALAAACDLNGERARRFCRDYGFARAYTDMEAMLAAEKPDAVVCVLPVPQIAPAGSRLLRRGIPCVLEKPLGSSRAEAEMLVEAARETGTPHLVSVNRRFSPYLNRAIRWARDAGPLRYVRGQMFRHARREETFPWETGVHAVDALRHIAGEWESFDLQRVERSPGATPWFLIRVRFASGCAGAVEILPTAGMVEETFELFGDDFRACATTMSPAGESVRCWRGGKREVDASADPGGPRCLRDGSYEETCAFLRCLREGAPLRPTVQDVAPSVDLCWQIAGSGGYAGTTAP